MNHAETVDITIEFADVYGGQSHIRVETISVPAPPTRCNREGLDAWAADYVFPYTGDGNAVDKEAGYFAEIVECTARPDLRGTEFVWGC